MLVNFCKLVGAGNDFIAVDNRNLDLPLDRETIAALCDRHFGIGADGLLAVEPPETKAATFRMRYYNADGGEAEMCGNGARCFAVYAANLLPFPPAELAFDTRAGLIHATFTDELVEINLSQPHGLRLDTLETELGSVHFLNTGVPHACLFLKPGKTLDQVDVKTAGSHLRFHPAFAPAGTNANFLEVVEPGHIRIRTYERGVEDETLACGTGVTASALLHHLLTGAPSPIRVTVAGGDTLQVGFEANGNDFTHVTLTGPADFIFEGTVEL